MNAHNYHQPYDEQEKTMEKLLSDLRQHVADLARDPNSWRGDDGHEVPYSNFNHDKWFPEYHLQWVETLSTDLCEFYPEAKRDVVIAMAWMHDYGKILDFNNQYDHAYIERGRKKMIELGFDEVFATTVADNIKVFDAKENIDQAAIEIRIVSSADACSHLSGPFHALYWWENPDRYFEDIMRENVRKMTVDWEQKMTLPEAKRVYEPLHQAAIDRARGELLRIKTDEHILREKS